MPAASPSSETLKDLIPYPPLCLHTVETRYVLADWSWNPLTLTHQHQEHLLKPSAQQTLNPGTEKPEDHSMLRGPLRQFHLPLDAGCPQEPRAGQIQLHTIRGRHSGHFCLVSPQLFTALSAHTHSLCAAAHHPGQ